MYTIMRILHVRQLCIGLLLPLVIVYLAAATGVQLSHDLAETVDHQGQASQEGYHRPIPHDCHSCLASHPNVSVHGAKGSPIFLGLKHHGRPSTFSPLFRTSDHQSGFSARSPPA
ncbi:MAG: hypothetical protein V3R94_07865 [Acidobacteriota bacterium]